MGVRRASAKLSVSTGISLSANITVSVGLSADITVSACPEALRCQLVKKYYGDVSLS